MQEILEDIGQVRAETDEVPELKQAKVKTAPIDKFARESVDDIRKAKKGRQLAASTVKSFNNKEQFLKPEYRGRSISRDDWNKWIFRIHHGIDQVRSDDLKYMEFIYEIYKYLEWLKQKQKSQKATNEITSKREEWQDTPGAIGSGFGTGTRGSGLITPCPNNVLADVERLKLLIGGKRAGNNSPEIINEAAAICQRLFTGGIMDINVYRSPIDEIVDNYRSD